MASFVLPCVFTISPGKLQRNTAVGAIPATVQGYIFFCLLAGFHFVNENTFVVIFLRSTRPLLCLLKRPAQSKKYRAERPPFFVSFRVRKTSKKY